MKQSLRLIVASLALASLPVALHAGEGATCTSAKACCAATTAKCEASTASTCSASKGPQVTLKLKGGRNANLGTTLAKLDGISAADTCSESKFTTIRFDKDKVCASKIMAALQDAGYRIQTQRVTYAVEGMSCGACSTKVTKALSKLRGVSDAKVCAESKQAVIDFNPSRVSVDKILATLDASGFKASEAVN
jgi:copper ion binding protein